jgi:hypothetical protein
MRDDVHSYDELVCALGKATPLSWHNVHGYGTSGFWRAVEQWFTDEVVPVVEREKSQAILSDARRTTMTGLAGQTSNVKEPTVLADKLKLSGRALRGVRLGCWPLRRRNKEARMQEVPQTPAQEVTI